jgi:glycosyltransferase involved in cell wall biosynthesis
MLHPIRVHLTGGQQTGWALDADVATTRRALESLPDLIHLTSLEEAEVVHSVWEETVLRMDAGRLDGKRVLSHVCNEVMRTFEMPVMARARERIGLWIPISHEAENNLRLLGYHSIYMPYTVDTTVFTPALPDGQNRQMLRKQWNLPEDAYVIGSFMRDSRVDNLSLPKPQKGVELFLEIVSGLWKKRLPIHVLLAGPRRHWLREQLRRAGIPFTFVGHEVGGDDNHMNILDPGIVNLLYHSEDLHLVTSRWEGGPRAALEAAATCSKIVSTPVGISCDMLDPVCIFDAVDKGIALIEKDIHERYLDSTVGSQYSRVMDHHVPEANVPILRRIYEGIRDVPVFRKSLSKTRSYTLRNSLAQKIGSAYNIVRLVMGSRPCLGVGLCIGLWQEIYNAPHSGGNQFMFALRRALQGQGVRVVLNRMTSAIDLHICSSAWFDRQVFERVASRGPIRMIHLIDGPTDFYHDKDSIENGHILEINRRWASATVFQSAWCFHNMVAKGLAFIRPMIIRNAANPGHFYPPSHRLPSKERKVRIISISCSDNSLKGESIYKWLDEHFDTDRFEYTHVSNIKQEFRNIRYVPYQDSRQLGDLLRQQDLYITAVCNEPSFDALLEAMACGLPALYPHQTGYGEVVGFGGLPFHGPEDLLIQLTRLTENIEAFRSCLWLQTIDEIANRYIELARLLINDMQ